MILSCPCDVYYFVSFSFTAAAAAVVLSRSISFVLVRLIQLHGSPTRSNRDEPASDQSHFRKKAREGNTQTIWSETMLRDGEQWSERYRSTSAFFPNGRWSPPDFPLPGVGGGWNRTTWNIDENQPLGWRCSKVYRALDTGTSSRPHSARESTAH